MVRPADTSNAAHEAQMEIYRRMSPSQRLEIGVRLSALGRELVEEGIRRRHPEYEDDEVRLARIRGSIGPELFKGAYPGELEP